MSEQQRIWTWLWCMPVLLTPPYVVSNHLTWLPAWTVPVLAPDRLVPFTPWAAWVYLGLFPLMWAAVLVQPTASDARRVVFSAAACAWTASAVFVFLPTQFPRPLTVNGLHGLITIVDTPRNACPSLHGTYCVHAAAWISRAQPRWRLVAWSGVVAILLATIAVRQHGCLDLAAGGLLGALAYRLGCPKESFV